MIKRLGVYRPHIQRVIKRSWSFLFGSFFRFLILLGLLFHAMGAFWVEGIKAGHLAIYGTTAIGIGVLGWVISWWKIQGEY